MPENLLDGRVELHCGDSLKFLRDIPDNWFDSIVTDPPYALVSIGKRFGADGAAAVKVPEGGSGAYARASAGFMGKKWDTGETAFAVEFWEQCLRVLKPGGHVVAFGGTRTYHRLACAIEDAGFEIRDMVSWTYGSGFPKSHDVSKGIDRRGPPGQAPFAEFAVHYEARRKVLNLTHAKICAAGKWHGDVNHGGSSVNWANGYGMPTTEQWIILQPLLGLDEKWKERVERVQYEREVLGIKHGSKLAVAPGQGLDRSSTPMLITGSGSDDAAKWEGWGTALKPAVEPICLARKPLIGTVAENVLRFGVGALNIDGCRIHGDDAKGYEYTVARTMPGAGQNKTGERKQDGVTFTGMTRDGRWPANLVHDGSEEVLAAFPAEAGAFAPVRGTEPSNSTVNVYGARNRTATVHHGDSGSAARFFYTAKADADDRLGSKHPTVKPVDLMQWLVRMVTPKGGLVLDPFAGTGTTAEACFREGMRCMLVEREEEYQADIRRRMSLVLGGPEERRRESIKAKTKDQPIDAGPLFATIR